MEGKLQGSSAQVVDATPAQVWAIVADAGRLPEWVPVVDQVVRHERQEAAGSVRRCNVKIGGKRGYIVERCLEAEPERRLTHAVDDDSLGFTKLFADYAFTLNLEPRSEGGTLVTCDTFYSPKGPVSGLLNAVLMRRRFAGVREQILLGLKELAERSPRELSRSS